MCPYTVGCFAGTQSANSFTRAHWGNKWWPGEKVWSAATQCGGGGGWWTHRASLSPFNFDCPKKCSVFDATCYEIITVRILTSHKQIETKMSLPHSVSVSICVYLTLPKFCLLWDCSSDNREVRWTLDKCFLFSLSVCPPQAGGLSATASPETAVALKQWNRYECPRRRRGERVCGREGWLGVSPGGRTGNEKGRKTLTSWAGE